MHIIDVTNATVELTLIFGIKDDLAEILEVIADELHTEAENIASCEVLTIDAMEDKIALRVAVMRRTW